uniref:U17-Eretoxin-Ek1h_1 n=1 Tax=Eresus cinnaberinus TaxID=175337 RepID=A0A2D0PC76_ERECI
MNSKICILIFLVAAVAIATSEKHCPMPRDLSSCTLKSKKMMCKQSDCRSTDVCCKEPCGNVCQRAVDRPVYGGVKVNDGERCTEGWQK